MRLLRGLVILLGVGVLTAVGAVALVILGLARLDHDLPKTDETDEAAA